MYCKIIGKECIGEDCLQYSEKTFRCEIDKRIGHFLYSHMTMSELSNFTRWVETLRPVHGRKKV